MAYRTAKPITTAHNPGMHQLSTVNRLVEGLPRNERKRLIRASETVDFASGEVLCSPGQLVEFAWFPLSGLISRSARVAGHPPMEVAMTGNEGMLGETLATGLETSPWRAVGQSAGTALRIPANDFMALAGDYPELQRAAYGYLFEMISAASRATPCTRFHGVEERLARWLLMTDDRTRADHIDLTHQSLANTLGVQRSAVTLAAGALQTQGLIHYSRGRISILSRDGLAAASCGCYTDADRVYAGQFALH